MKKRCTNSSCRRTFTVKPDQEQVRCPRCGKIYPRIHTPKNARTKKPVRIRISSLNGLSKILAIKALRKAMGLMLVEAKNAIDPLFSGERVFLDLETGRNLKESTRIAQELQEAGLSCRVLSPKHC